jgi:hypothetical protein
MQAVGFRKCKYYTVTPEKALSCLALVPARYGSHRVVVVLLLSLNKSARLTWLPLLHKPRPSARQSEEQEVAGHSTVLPNTMGLLNNINYPTAAGKI